ncbi:MAG: elongation factor G [Epsilonproteobacteria bacterium]|nr:elongation factor G [Campylobacterota bacterium]
MKVYNVALIGQRSSGKTILSERILFETKNISRMGSTADGNSTTDYHRTEISRGFSIQLSLFNFNWKDDLYSAIDTPGYSNFIGDALCGIGAVDNIIYVADSSDDLKANGFRLLQQTRKRSLPTLIFINKLDAERSDYEKCFEAIRTVDNRAVLMQLPVGKTNSVINLLASDEFPDEISEKALAMKEKLTESIVESDDQLLEKYLEGEKIETEALRDLLKKDVISGAICPVFVGSALTGMGINELLDAASRWFISGGQRILDIDRDKSEIDDILIASVFKTFNDPKSGRTNCIRIWSGSMKSDSTYYNTTKKTVERIGGLLRLQGKKAVPIETAAAGELIAVNKLKETLTGDTLTTDQSSVSVKTPDMPPTLIRYRILGKSKQDTEKIGGYLSKILEEDISLKFEKNRETNEFVLSGMGKLHIDITVEKLKKRYGVEVIAELPSVPYKETIKKEVTAQGRYKKQTGGHGQFGDCKIVVAPSKSYEDGVLFIDQIVGGAIPRQYIPSVEKGIRDALKKGKLGEYPVTGISIRLTDGSYHPVDSSDLAFQMAGQIAIKKALDDASPVLIEPIYKVEIICREGDVGAVIGDLNSRRGEVVNMRHHDDIKEFRIVDARMPKTELLSYAPALRSLTAGFGRFTSDFERYKEVPEQIAKTILQAAQ